MFNAKQFCDDHDIHIPDRSQNTQEGWINIQCPFPDCDDRTNHGGFNIDGAYYYCWKCGWHKLTDVIIELINCTHYEAKQIINQYDKGYKPKQKVKSAAKKIVLPPETTEFKKAHKKYLLLRNFNPEKLQKIWGLKGTRSVGTYSHRIIAPITYKGQLVTYQARDITNKSSIRYKACKIENEVMHHKHILYGIDNITNRKGVIVEGITDVWRLGPGALSSFGTSYTIQQVRFIKDNLDEIYILYDFSDMKAQKKALDLYNDLSVFRKKVEIIQVNKKGDPADLTQKEADKLMKILLKM